MLVQIPRTDKHYLFDTESSMIYRRESDNVVKLIYPNDCGNYMLDYLGNQVIISRASILCSIKYGVSYACDPLYTKTKKGYIVSYDKSNLVDCGDILLINGEVFVPSPRWSWLYSNLYGAIFDTNLNEFRIQHHDKDGYMRFTPIKSCTNVAAHRFVFECWTGIQIPSSITIHHRDSNKSNNDFMNLELVTSAQNTRYSILNGEKRLERIFTEDDVHTMCQMMVNGKTYRDIANVFNMTSERDYHNFRNRLSMLLNKTGWKDISSRYDFTGYCGNIDPNQRFSSDDIREFHALRHQGMMVKDIAKKFNTTPRYVSEVLNGRKRQNVCV